MKRSLLTPAALLLLTINATYAQKTWIGSGGTGGNGQWNVSDNWIGGVPANTTSTANRALFFVSDTYTSSTATIEVEAGTAAVMREILQGNGKNVLFNMGTGSSLSIGTQSYIGGDGTLVDGSTGTGSAHLSFMGPEAGSATLNISSFYVGMDASGGQHSLTFSGNLVVNEVSALFSMIGRRGNGNELHILNGADVTRTGLRIGGQEGLKDNKAFVDGAGSRLLVNGGHSNRGLLLGAITGTSYNNSSSGNRLSITNGGKVEVTTGADGTSTNSLGVGTAAFARSNHVVVSGADSKLELQARSIMNIGNSVGSGLGGNSVQVRDGGTIDTTGTISIYGYNENSGANDGANRLIVGNGGELSTDSAILSAGLVVLEAGGVLKGRLVDETPAAVTMTFSSGGRFEAAGDGLGESVNVILKTDALLVIGTSEDTEARSFSLDSALTMEGGSVLEFSIFNDGTYDQIVLGNGADFVIDAGTLLRLDEEMDSNLAYGTTVELFGGDLSRIQGDFDLTGIDLNRWDISKFNSAGDWKLVAIPEPGMGLLLLAGGGCLMLLRRKNFKR